MSRPFQRLVELGALAPLDRALGDLVARQAATGTPAADPTAGDPDNDRDLLALTAALLSRERGRGHSCILPRAWAGRPFPGVDADIEDLNDGTAAPPPTLPSLDAWWDTLRRSPLVGDGRRPTPLVAEGGRLYFYRYWRAEQRLAGRLRGLLDGSNHGADPSPLDAEAVAPLFQQLFPTSDDGPDWQAVAAAAALGGRLALVSGGPGTGKTTTVGKILALLLTAWPTARIALAAPTGKAAARLGESITGQVSGEDLPDGVLERLPRQASTLHRLLGYRFHDQNFRHGADFPLTCDVLVVDEASMVDLLLMDAVVDALPNHGRLLLLGDRHQLTSVETGFVFGDLCRAAQQLPFSPGFSDLYGRLSGQPLPSRPQHRDAVDTPHPAETTRVDPLGDAAVELRKNYRFRDQQGIAVLADAIRRQDEAAMLSTLDDPGFGEVTLMRPGTALHPDAALRPDGALSLGTAPDSFDTTVLEAIADHLSTVHGAESVAEALAHLGGFRLLAAVRRGPWGVETLNALVERHLVDEGWISSSGIAERSEELWYRGKPVMVVENDYPLRLFNGDLGICWPTEDDDERLEVVFPDPEGGEGSLRRLPLAKLPPHETAWAMTVHKSQGSEFDRVLLVLGDTGSPILSRELLYTAITRARRSVSILATDGVLAEAIDRRTRRNSGLRQALRPRPTPEPTPGDPVVDAPALEEPVAAEPVAAEPIAAEPVTAKTVTAEPATEESTTDTPAEPTQLSLFDP